MADANETRDWRIYAEFAQVMIRRARALYIADKPDLGIDGVLYVVDSTTIDLCLALFPWAPFHSTKAAIKLHTMNLVRHEFLFRESLGHLTGESSYR